MKGRTVIRLFMLLIPFAVVAQEKYADVSPAQKQVFLQENFDTSQGWTISRNGTLEGGLLVLKKSKAWRTMDLDFSRSFEIEFSVASNQSSLQFEIILGEYVVDFTPRFTGLHTIDMVNALKIRRDDAINSNHSGTSIESANVVRDKFSKYTIRKSGSLYYMFVNEQSVVTYYFPPFKEIGIKTKHATIEVDHMTISYLDSRDEIMASRPTISASEVPIATSVSSGRFYALLIGVSDYVDNRLDLEKPARDAQQLKTVLLQNYTFSDSTILTLINPTRQNIIVALFNLRKVIKPQDNLLIFYAGHGYWDEEARQGYWWARDATANDPSNWLSNSDVREQVRSIKSKHTLLISDACFSGGIFRTRGADALKQASLDIQLLYKLPSRRAITSGTMTTVPDKSVFFEYLIKRLQENGQYFMTSQQLFDSFRQAVINNSLVVPQDGIIAEAGDEGGDFIFVRRK